MAEATKPVQPAATPVREAASVAADALAEAGDRTRATLARLLDRMPRSAGGDAARTRRSRIEPSFGGASGP